MVVLPDPPFWLITAMITENTPFCEYRKTLTQKDDSPQTPNSKAGGRERGSHAMKHEDGTLWRERREARGNEPEFRMTAFARRQPSAGRRGAPGCEPTWASSLGEGTVPSRSKPDPHVVSGDLQPGREEAAGRLTLTAVENALAGRMARREAPAPDWSRFPRLALGQLGFLIGAIVARLFR